MDWWAYGETEVVQKGDRRLVTGLDLGIFKCTAPGDVVSGRLKITFIRWVGGTTADHVCIIRAGGASGTIIFESKADGADFLDVMAIRRWIDGVYVDTLQSGSVFIYTE